MRLQRIDTGELRCVYGAIEAWPPEKGASSKCFYSIGNTGRGLGTIACSLWDGRDGRGGETAELIFAAHILKFHKIGTLNGGGPWRSALSVLIFLDIH